jgi:hypothetical protein
VCKSLEDTLPPLSPRFGRIVQERILKLHEALQKEKERLKNDPDDDEEYLKSLQDMLKDAKEELNGISKA